MALTLVTGPANSAKAQVVLDRFRAALGRAPLLIVPRAADVEHYRRELAQTGAVLGAAVEAFGGLAREIARRAGVTERPISAGAREHLLGAVCAREPLEVLAAAARAPGFVRSLAALVAELEARRVEPARFASALRAWAPGRRYGEELARLYGAYRRRLERLGLLDAELAAARALDILARSPERWGRTPVFVYGFDDLEPLQLDAIETLALRVGAPVTLSLPGEPGRVALAGRAATLETLRPRAEQVIALEPVDRHYDDPALHHLERALFEDATEPRPAGRAVALLEGGDERAEAELVAAGIAELIDGGCPAGEIAVVTRGAPALIAAALEQRGIAHVADRRERFGDTALGGGLLALLRGELVRWLRTPGVVARTALLDRFEATLRRTGVTDPAQARALWTYWPLDALDRVREGPGLLDRVERELETLLAAPVRREAALIDRWDAAVVAAGRRTIASLRELAAADRGLAPTLPALARALEETLVELPAAHADGAVALVDALALRARRVRALFIAGVQEGSFPASPAPEPFLTASDRAEIARASGLVLGGMADTAAAERYLFYALCSRPTEWLRVSWHDSSDADAPALRSLFVDDLVDCFDDGLLEGRTIRAAGAPPPGLEDELAQPRLRGPVIGPADPRALAGLRARAQFSASALERWVACPVSWFVERGLHAEDLEPQAVPLARGSAAHDALHAVLGGLRERTGSARVDRASLPLALELLDGALAAPSLEAVERRRLADDLRRYLRHAAQAGDGAYEPRELELAFGLEEGGAPAVALAGGTFELAGRIDRVDVDPISATAVVYDYKTSGSVDGARTWRGHGRLQPALYMLVVERLLGLEPIAGLYQPLRGPDLRPRGAVRADADPGVPLVSTDRLEPDDFRELIEHQLAVAAAAAAELARGALEPRPQSCSPSGRCRHPAICRCEGR